MELHEHKYQSDFARKYYSQGVDDGYTQGVNVSRTILRKQLERRFGPLPADVNTRLDQADAETLSAWAERILSAGSLAEVVSG